MSRFPLLLLALLLTACAPPPDPVWVVPDYPSPSPVELPVIGHGTNVPPSPTPSRASRSRLELPRILLLIRSCESGPRGYATHGQALDADYSNVNPSSGASGAYQFLDSTWRYVTGLPGKARDYSRRVQDAAALKLYRSEGTTPWISSRPCWGHR